MRRLLCLTTLLLPLTLLLLPGVAWATPGAAALPSLAPTLLKTAASLAGVCALAFVTIRFVLPRLHPGARRRGDARHLEVLEQITVAPRRTILLLQARGQLLVVGSSEAGLQTLAVLPPDATFEDALLRAAQEAPPDA